MNRNRQIVAIVDNDESVRESLPPLLIEMGYAVFAYSSASAFLASTRISQVSCLLLDIAMPEMSGIELQQTLRQRGFEIPIIYITAQCDEAIRLQLLREGAVACLFKPFNEAALLSALSVALRAHQTFSRPET